MDFAKFAIKCVKKKPVKQMDEKDFNHMNLVLSEASGLGAIEKQCQYNYWQKIVIERIEYLTPLIKECEENKFDLMTLSKELAQEWIELHDAVDLYLFKKITK
jgi:hypothetical protein